MAFKTPRRIVAYVRVSRVMGREGDGYISPEVQTESIQRWATYAGADVVEVCSDEDVSGGTKASDRAGLSRAFSLIEQGKADGLAVARLNRFSRSTLSALRDLERLEEMGGEFVSVEEEFDTANPFGRFALTMMLAVATLERDNLVASWKVAKARALDRGAKIGPTPFGYVRRDDGTLEPHRERAAYVVEAFKRARDGIEPVVEYLDGLGLVHETGKRAGRPLVWTAFTVRRLLANRTYLGAQHWGDEVREDSHPALVKLAAWKRAQHEPPPRRQPSASFPLSGIPSCGTCGAPMVGGRAGKGLRTYRCTNSFTAAKRQGRGCPAPATMVADRLEERLDEVLAEWANSYGALTEVEDGEQTPSVEQALVEAEDADAELAAYVQNTPARLPGYGDGLVLREEESEAKWAAYREAAEAQSRRERLVVRHRDLEDLTPDERTQLVRDVVERIEVNRGRGPVEERVKVNLYDHAAPEAPIPGWVVGAPVREPMPELTDADAPPGV